LTEESAMRIDHRRLTRGRMPLSVEALGRRVVLSKAGVGASAGQGFVPAFFISKSPCVISGGFRYRADNSGAIFPTNPKR
jgi:hypothetical protein